MVCSRSRNENTANFQSIRSHILWHRYHCVQKRQRLVAHCGLVVMSGRLVSEPPMLRHVRQACLAAIFAVPPLFAQQSGPFTVGSATATPGTTAYGSIAIPAASDSALRIAVPVVRGARPGPTVAFVAGSHGTEYTSIIALQQLIARIDATKLAGTVIIAPLLNVASFEAMTPHINPIDRKGMNSSYPGDPKARRLSARSPPSPNKSWRPRTSSLTCTAAISMKIFDRTATGTAADARHRTRLASSLSARSVSTTSSSRTSIQARRRPDDRCLVTPSRMGKPF